MYKISCDFFLSVCSSSNNSDIIPTPSALSGDHVGIGIGVGGSSNGSTRLSERMMLGSGPGQKVRGIISFFVIRIAEVPFAQGCQMAKFDPFLSLVCAPTPSTLAQSKERKGSNFAA